MAGLLPPRRWIALLADEGDPMSEPAPEPTALGVLTVTATAEVERTRVLTCSHCGEGIAVRFTDDDFDEAVATTRDHLAGCPGRIISEETP